MSINRLSGSSLDLDAHTTNLLEIYTRAVNRWKAEKLKPQTPEDCPYLPGYVGAEELAQNLLARALADEIERLGAWV